MVYVYHSHKFLLLTRVAIIIIIYQKKWEKIKCGKFRLLHIYIEKKRILLEYMRGLNDFYEGETVLSPFFWKMIKEKCSWSYLYQQ